MGKYTFFFYNSDMGVVGQVLEWPDVLSVGRNVSEAKKMLSITLTKRIEHYRKKGMEIPTPQIKEEYDERIRESKAGI